MDHDISLDFPVNTTITEAYLEAAYEFLSQERMPDFYYPPSDSFYVKAAIRERFPGSFAPCVLDLEDMLIADRMMPERRLKPGIRLRPDRLSWPPRIRKGAVPKSHIEVDNDAPPF